MITLIFLFPAFPDDRQIGEAAAWPCLFSQWTEKHSTVYEELSCKGKGRREEVKTRAHFWHFILHFEDIYIYIKCSEFPSLIVKGVVTLAVCTNLLVRQYFRLLAVKACLSSFKSDYILYKISGWHFQKQGFMSFKGN